MNRQIQSRQKARSAGLLVSSLALLGAHSTTVVAENLAIDLFESFQVVSDVANGGAGQSASTWTGIDSILGGQRDINASTWAGGVNNVGDSAVCDTGDACTSLTAGGGVISLNIDTSVFGSATIQWDGGDQDILLVHDGLGGLDVTDGGRGSALDFTIIESDHGFAFTIEAYTNATSYVKYTLESTEVLAGSPEIVELPFALFEETLATGYCDGTVLLPDQVLEIECGPDGYADFGNLGALQVQINVPHPNGSGRAEALDVEVGDIEVPLEDCCDGGGSVAPTGATCDDFVNNDPIVLLDGIDMTVGEPKGRSNGLVITNMSDPGAAFYFTRFTTSGDPTVGILQNSSGGPSYEMDLTGWNLYSVEEDTVNGGLICSSIENLSFKGPNAGEVDTNIDIQFSETLPLGDYAMRIRINPKSIIGEVDPTNSLINNFTTTIQNVEVDSDPDGILLERIDSTL